VAHAYYWSHRKFKSCRHLRPNQAFRQTSLNGVPHHNFLPENEKDARFPPSGLLPKDVGVIGIELPGASTAETGGEVGVGVEAAVAEEGPELAGAFDLLRVDGGQEDGVCVGGGLGEDLAEASFRRD
jgi:hypothetical protein